MTRLVSVPEKSSENITCTLGKKTYVKERSATPHKAPVRNRFSKIIEIIAKLLGLLPSEVS